MWGRWRRRVRYWRHGAERARLLREEMEFHMEMMAGELMEDGMTESEARAAARRQFGNATQKQEESRGTWIARWLSDLLQDAAFAARTLRRQPGFAAVAVLSAALGIGACSLIFGLANFALFRPLPVSDAGRLVSISGKNPVRGKTGQSISYPDLMDLRKAQSIEAITGFFGFMPAVIGGSGEPQRTWGTLATANYFDVVRPAFVLGRGFDANRDDRKGEAPVIVLSHRLWRSRFDSDPGIVGRTIEWNRRKVTVVGVTAAGFQGTEAMFLSEFWVPFSMIDGLAGAGIDSARLENRGGQWLAAAARLRTGATAKGAAAEIDVIGARLRKSYPETNENRWFHVERAGQVNPGMRKLILALFLMLMGVAALVLFTACANVANLLLARGSARQREIATRLAIGAGRGRLVRQLLTESGILALAGGAAGYALAQFGVFGIGRVQLPLPLPLDLSVSLDYRVMLFSTGLSALTGLIFGLVPALRATRPGLAGAMKDARFGPRNLLAVTQVAISMVLLICSGLFLRSLYAAQRIDTGMAHRNLLMLSFDPSLNRYTAAETGRLIDAMLEGARAIPGVQTATVTSAVPLSLAGTQNMISTEDQGEAGRIRADVYSVAPRFFETFGIRMLAGEDFRPGVPADDIAIINQALADAAFPRQNPLGRRILYLGRKVRVAGVAATTKSRTIGEEAHPCMYFPLARDLRGNDSLTGITLVLRTAGDPGAYAPLARRAIREIDPSLAVFEVRTMEAHLLQAMFLPRTTALLFGLAGLTGLLIATIGIYGVVSFGVARRTREIGIRMALGATRGKVLAGVLRQGIGLVAAGAAIGLGLAMAGSRVAASLLYGVKPTDAATFVGVPVFLLLVGAAACLVPARRAASVEPASALRWE